MNSQIDLFNLENEVIIEKKVPKQRVGIIDADVVLYQACSAGRVTPLFPSDDPDAEEYSYNLDFAKQAFDRALERIKVRLNLDYYIVCISDKQNFRKIKIPGYKANRTTPKPVLYNSLKQWCQSNYNYVVYSGMEADDTCGILATECPVDQIRIRVSIDKDFLSVPGKFYDMNKDIEYNITWHEAFSQLVKQILMGDSVDGYYGLPGIGPKKAQKIMDEILAENHISKFISKKDYVIAVFNDLVQYFHEYLKDKEDIEDIDQYFWWQTQCAFILREGCWDGDKKKIRLINKNNFAYLISGEGKGL